MDMNENGIEILKVVMSPDGEHYNVSMPAGSNASETAFVIAVVIKCLNKDGVIKTQEMLDAITKYCTDPQYEEVKEDEMA